MSKVWIIDDDPSIRWVLERALNRAGVEAATFDSAVGVADRLGREPPDVVVTDVRMPGPSGLELLDEIRRSHPTLPVIIVTAHSDLEAAVTAYQGGAFEYLPKPFDVDEAVALIRRAMQRRPTSPAAAAVLPAEPRRIVGEAPAMQDVFRVIGRLANSSMNVLLCGESGTGKELVARALHAHSPRAGAPFVAINTAAIPAELLESELFGHEKGAFTGAHTQRAGRFEQADGGTLFLDEIGDMPEALQTRLLRVLADGNFYRVGGRESLHADVRVIAATNRDLDARVADGRFRADLFHRLNVIRIDLPPLRERAEDVPALVRFFLERAAEELGIEPKEMEHDALEEFTRYRWPGNVRELENVCRRLTVMAPDRRIALMDVPEQIRSSPDAERSDWEQSLRRAAASRLALGASDLAGEFGVRFERTLLETALAHTDGRKQEAARCLGWGRNTLTRKLKSLQVRVR